MRSRWGGKIILFRRMVRAGLRCSKPVSLDKKGARRMTTKPSDTKLADEIFQQITCNNAWHGPACPDCNSTATLDYEMGFEAGCAFAMSTMRERAEKKADSTMSDNIHEIEVQKEEALWLAREISRRRDELAAELDAKNALLEKARHTATNAVAKTFQLEAKIDALHIAVCDAVQLLNRTVNDNEQRQAREILRQALVDYADI
jgi:hypothetical protein